MAACNAAIGITAIASACSCSEVRRVNAVQQGLLGPTSTRLYSFLTRDKSQQTVQCQSMPQHKKKSSQKAYVANISPFATSGPECTDACGAKVLSRIG